MYAASIKNELVVLIHNLGFPNLVSKCEHYSLLKGVAVLTKRVDLHMLHGICMWYLLQTHNKNSMFYSSGDAMTTHMEQQKNIWSKTETLLK